MNAAQLEQLHSEVGSLSQLDHPNILKVYDYKPDGLYTNSSGASRQMAYLVTEYVPNCELLGYCNIEALPEELCRFYTKQILSAIIHMQKKGFAHRDIKPDNIALDADFNVKILDFGAACELRGDNSTGLVSSFPGTPMYMSPEIESGSRYRASDADLFALAVTLFVMKV